MDLHGAAPQWLPFAPFTSGKMVAITAAAGHLYGATAKGTEANPGWQLIKKTIGDVTGAIYNPLTDPVRTPPRACGWAPASPSARGRAVATARPGSGRCKGRRTAGQCVRLAAGGDRRREADSLLRLFCRSQHQWTVIGECMDPIALTSTESRLYACCSNLRFAPDR